MVNVIDKGPCLGMRHLQSFLIFLNILVIINSRLNVGIAIVSMTNAETTNSNFMEFNWNSKEISYIFSSFYWGYMGTQLIGAALSKRYGTRKIMGLSTLASAILSAIIPVCVTWGGWKAFCGIRFLLGLSQGVIFPSIHHHLSKWCPVDERNRLAGLCYTGWDCGTVISMFVGGLIAAGSFGWPGIFYLSAVLCFVWCILWWLYAADNTTKSKYITEAEKNFIESSLEHSDDFHKKKIPIPLKAIFTSVPFLAMVATRCSDSWGGITMQTQISLYLNGVLDMNIKNNALFSSLPFLVTWGVSYVFVILADIIQHKNILTLTGLRKTYNTIAEWVPVITLTGISFLDKNQTKWALALLIINSSTAGCVTIGCVINTIDLSPNHAGILMGIANTGANFVALVAPLVAGAIITDSSDHFQWQIVFIITAIILFVGNLIYLIWGSTKRQPWDADDFLEPKRLAQPSNAVNLVISDPNDRIDVKK